MKKGIRNNYLHDNKTQLKEDYVCFQYYKTIKYHGKRVTLIGKDHSKILNEKCLKFDGHYIFEYYMGIDKDSMEIADDDRRLLPKIYWNLLKKKKHDIQEIVEVIDECINYLDLDEDIIERRNKYYLNRDCEKLLYDTFSPLLECNVLNSIENSVENIVIFVGGIQHCKNLYDYMLKCP